MNLKRISSEKCPRTYDWQAQQLVTTLHDEGHQLYRAAQVITLTPHIRQYLEKHDPKALEQLLRAMGD